MAKVLLYNVNENYDIEKFELLAIKNKVQIIRAEKEDSDQYIGYLLGYDGFKKRDTQLEMDPDLDFPFILFVNFDRDQLFEFLDQMRENGLAIQHKAGETENNVKWTLRELLIENDREGKMMGLIHKINSLVERASFLKKQYGEDKKLAELIDEMQAYFDDSSLFEFEVAKNYYEKLKEEVKRVESENN
ncbi:MAG: DUF3783 domain-containing protein [Anaerococcus sp.]|nr:DUF3783 domain-containing protein [Anaerococcus sp.]